LYRGSSEAGSVEEASGVGIGVEEGNTEEMREDMGHDMGDEGREEGGEVAVVNECKRLEDSHGIRQL
jgi:hypothetical protein